MTASPLKRKNITVADVSVLLSLERDILSKQVDGNIMHKAARMLVLVMRHILYNVTSSFYIYFLFTAPR